MNITENESPIRQIMLIFVIKFLSSHERSVASGIDQ